MFCIVRLNFGFTVLMRGYILVVLYCSVAECCIVSARFAFDFDGFNV